MVFFRETSDESKKIHRVPSYKGLPCYVRNFIFCALVPFSHYRDLFVHLQTNPTGYTQRLAVISNTLDAVNDP